MKNGGKNKSVAFIILFSIFPREHYRMYMYRKYISRKYFTLIIIIIIIAKKSHGES